MKATRIALSVCATPSVDGAMQARVAMPLTARRVHAPIAAHRAQRAMRVVGRASAQHTQLAPHSRAAMLTASAITFDVDNLMVVITW